MSVTPPRLAARLLSLTLRNDPAVPAILGDLHEDLTDIARNRGNGAARRWYWREALLLSLGRLRSPRSSPSGGGPANSNLSPGQSTQDVVYALRSLRSNPGFSVFTALVMGLGIAAVTTVFSVMKPLVLAPLPFPESHELVWIARETEPGDTSLSAVTSRSANLVDFRERSRLFAGLTGYNAFFNHAPYTLTGIDEPERLVGADVVHDLLEVLGVDPLHGRGFLPEEGRPGGPAAVILSYDMFQRLFAADGGIVGESLSLNGLPHTVVGVLPAHFDFSSMFSPSVKVDFLLPFMLLAADEGGFQGNTLHLIGRLNPGATVAAAQAELDGILANLEQEDPARWGLSARATPLQAQIAGPFRPALVLLGAAAGAFLLLVCVNVSNLILARSLGRTREVALRKALGASRGRLTRQLLVETMLISLTGAAIGSFLAMQITGVVAGQAGVRIPLLDGVRVDATALLVAVGAAVLAGLLAGLFPAFKLSEGKEAEALRDGSIGMSASRPARRLRETLVIAQVTLACVLLLVTGLLVRSFEAVLSVDLGFEASNTVAWKLNPGLPFDTFAAKSNFYAGLADRVAQIPGIDNVGLVDELPLGINRHWPLRIVGAPPTDDPLMAFPHVVDPGYLPAMRIPLVQGRNLTRADDANGQAVVLINESAARAVFPGESALGRQLHFFGDSDWEIVGIVQDVRHVSPEADAGVQVYFPIAQMQSFHTLDLVVRSPRPVEDVAADVRAALADIDSSMPTRDFWTVQSIVDSSVSARRFTLSVLAAFGAAALLVAGLGIYGVVAHSVAERTPEIGIRRALGASSSHVVWGVMSRTLLLAGVGTLGGIALSLLSARLLASLVYGVGVRDPGTFMIGALLLLAVATMAAAVPATRAARTRGLVALGKG